jgi:uncharacterized protein YjiS (DUF1127 family)
MSRALSTPRVFALPGERGHDRLGRMLRAVVALLRAWRQRDQERRELARLTDRELRDIRVSRSEAIDEASKPFWRD